MANHEENENYEDFYFNVGDEIKAEGDPRNPRGDYIMDALGGEHSADAMQYEAQSTKDMSSAFEMLYGDPTSMDLNQQRAYPLSMLHGGWPEDIYQKGKQRFNDMGIEKITAIFDVATMSDDQLDSLPAIVQTDFLPQEAVNNILTQLENTAFEIGFFEYDVKNIAEHIVRAIPLLSMMGYLRRDEQEKLLVKLEEAHFEDMMRANGLDDTQE
jgi:hypothetical protein